MILNDNAVTGKDRMTFDETDKAILARDGRDALRASDAASDPKLVSLLRTSAQKYEQMARRGSAASQQGIDIVNLGNDITDRCDVLKANSDLKSR